MINMQVVYKLKLLDLYHSVISVPSVARKVFSVAVKYKFDVKEKVKS